MILKVIDPIAFEAAMKIKEHEKPLFDPTARLREKKPLIVTLTSEDWTVIEVKLGYHINGMQIRELIMGCFNGSHKIVKR